MSAYSIKDLEKISGIKSHTIRIWEQRYGLLKPNRTDTNIRYYDDDQMRKLLNISTLLTEGMKISSVAKLSEDDMNQHINGLVERDQASDTQTEALINQMIGAGLTYNEQAFEKAFSSALLRYNLKDVYVQIIYPMLIRMGLMWNSNDMMPAQEHFVSNLIKQKIFAAIDAIPVPVNPKETWVLFLPELEDHEIGLLLSSYLLRQSGKRVIYLGQRVPYSNLKAVIQTSKPDYMHFFLVLNQANSSIQLLLENLSKDFTGKTIYISGSAFIQNKLKLPKNFQWENSIENFL